MKSGKSKPLNVTKEAQHRIVIGLGWDPADEPGLIQRIGSMAKGQPTHHDLDLSCYIYDENKNLIDKVTAEGEFAVDTTGKIYHSGDNMEGIGEGDDEEISVELKNLSPHIHHFIFTAHISTGHNFNEVNSPEMRIADGYTNHNFLQTPIAPENEDDNLFVFIHLSRGEKDNWNLRFLDSYTKIKDILEIEEHLQSYL